MVLLESENIKLGTPAFDFQNLPSVDDKSYGLSDFKEKKILIIVFMCNHCPYVKAILDRLIKIQSDYESKGVQIIGINPNDAINYPEDNFESMQKIATEKRINFVYLRDEDQKVAKKYDAQCTPDIYVYNEKRELIYHGRIGDNWQEPEQITKHELREALNAYLKNKEIIEVQHPSMGCSIKWL